MGGKNSKNGVNTDFIATNDTMTNTMNTKYSAHVGDDTNQETVNSQTDAQVDSISFGGAVNTEGGHIFINPVQGNEQTPLLTSTSTQSVTIMHGKICLVVLKLRKFLRLKN